MHTLPKIVDVYGGDHSPWVQAVLLALHEKGIEHRTRQTPPLEVFMSWGVLQPAVSIDGAPWEIESSRILVKLGYAPISEDDLRSVQAAWRGVLHRLDNPLRFYAGFASIKDHSSSFAKRSVSNFLRSFIAFYMTVMISFVKITKKPRDPMNFGDQYMVWEQALQSSTQPFLDGPAPGTRDLLLFGVVQCHASIPVPPLGPLQHDQRLAAIRHWIWRMQQRLSDYPHLYSGKYFKPRLPQPETSNALQKVIFYLGLLTMFVFAPITLPLVFVLMKKVPR